MKRLGHEFFYTQPTFRKDDPDFLEALKNRSSTPTDFSLKSPVTRFHLAMDYYRFEAFATERARDARCGQTGHPGIRYAPATSEDLTRNDVSLDRIACGHDIDDPHFENVVSPLFDAAIRRLLQEIGKRIGKSDGDIASTEILIARTRYSLAAKAVGDFISFPISAMTVFEKEADASATERTIAWLENRLVLVASPSLIGATPS